MRPFVLHAHFYQPERLNPWTEALDPEPSAAPDRDWNARILRECYHPNGNARIFDSGGRAERIVNNYERLSFDFGPTLLAWMEEAAPRTYARILDGDWRSVVRTGHGNALAQAYNHVILPLANERDRRTQILWGLADFRYRFRREAEGMWLPETAADAATIDALIDAGVAFTVLAPHQIGRIKGRDGRWREHDDGIDSDRPYRILHRDGSGRSLAVFLYDGGLAQSLAFDAATAETSVLVEKLAHASGTGLVSAALDGETFGHHHRFGELGLAYALFVVAEARGLVPTSYAAQLVAYPPAEEIELVDGEGTAWSCAHGLGRWYRDCGCSTGGEAGWNQRWRTPLRAALDLVRDAGIEAFETRGAELFKDPWAARDDYVNLWLGITSPAEFFDRHGLRHLDDHRKVDARGLLEAQRHAMLMYTSCGWFFNDIGGLETVYVLRNAARVLGLLRGVGVDGPWDEVVERLGEAKSNRPEVGTGADVWQEQVLGAEVTPRRIGAHTALVGLVRPLPPARDDLGAAVEVRSHRLETRGRLALGTSRISVRSLSTGRRSDFAVAALYLGGLDFHGVIAPDPGSESLERQVEGLWSSFATAPVARLIRQVSEVLDGTEFGFEQLLGDGRAEVVGLVFGDLTERFHDQFSRLYHDHRRLLEMLTEAGFPLPRDLRAAAELTLSAQLERQLAAALPSGQAGSAHVPGSGAASALEAVRGTTALARAQGYRLDLTTASRALSDAIEHTVRDALAHPGADGPEAVARWMSVAEDLKVPIDLTIPQELVYEVAVKARAGRLGFEEGEVVARLGALMRLSPTVWSGGRV